MKRLRWWQFWRFLVRDTGLHIITPWFGFWMGDRDYNMRRQSVDTGIVINWKRSPNYFPGCELFLKEKEWMRSSIPLELLHR